MAELDMILDRMERLNADIHAAVNSNGKDRNTELLSLRGKFSAETGKLIGEISNDPRLKAKPDLAENFTSRLFEIRQKLAAHQAKWRSVSINEHFAEYSKATDAINASIKDYITWGKAQLANA